MFGGGLDSMLFGGLSGAVCMCVCEIIKIIVSYEKDVNKYMFKSQNG